MFTNKNERKYFCTLRSLAKLDNSILNQLKAVVCESEFSEENEHFFSASLMILGSTKNLSNQNSSRSLTEKSIENFTEHSKISSENTIKVLKNYPDSFDLSDDE